MVIGQCHSFYHRGQRADRCRIFGLSTLFNPELTQEYECGPPTMKPGKGDHPTYKTRHFSTLNSIHRLQSVININMDSRIVIEANSMA